MKQCAKCRKWKSVEKFSKNKSRRDGLQKECKQCTAAYFKSYYEKNHDDMRKKQSEYAVKNSAVAVARVKEWRRRNVEKASSLGKKWREKNPQKHAAHNAVEIAKQQGVLKKQPCEVCGETEVDAHHEDYSKPLDVMWLCRKHHNQIHQNKKEGSK